MDGADMPDMRAAGGSPRTGRGERRVVLGPVVTLGSGPAYTSRPSGERMTASRQHRVGTEPDRGQEAMAAAPRGAGSTRRWLWFLLRVGFAALAFWVAVAEPWDANGDGRITVHEVLLFPVRFIAFPLHVLLSLTPGTVVHWLGLPGAHWPSSAVLAVAVSLPLWGMVLVGGLVAEAWLARASEAGQERNCD
jgi:hypothetical protein